MRRGAYYRVRGTHLAVAVVVLTSGLLLLAGLVVRRLNELEAVCRQAPSVEITTDPVGSDEPPRFHMPEMLIKPCLKGPDGNFLRDADGVLICGEVL